MGIWQHTHTVTTTEVSPDLGEFTEILDDVNVEMIPLRYRWGGRTFQTASHIHVIDILGVWTPFTVVDGHMTAHSYRYHHRRIPRFRRAGWNPRWCKCQNYPTTLSLRLWNLSDCIPHPCHTYIRCLNTLNSCGWGYGSTLTLLPPQRFPQIWESFLIHPRWCQCENDSTMLSLRL
jgi:hypothetical protein